MGQVLHSDLLPPFPRPTHSPSSPLSLTLTAMTPGTARDRECYLLGDVKDEGLAAALVEEFLGEVSACLRGAREGGVV